jgi:hypothetical protein
MDLLVGLGRYNLSAFCGPLGRFKRDAEYLIGWIIRGGG